MPRIDRNSKRALRFSDHVGQSLRRAHDIPEAGAQVATLRELENKLRAAMKDVQSVISETSSALIDQRGQRRQLVVCLRGLRMFTLRVGGAGDFKGLPDEALCGKNPHKATLLLAQVMRRVPSLAAAAPELEALSVKLFKLEEKHAARLVRRKELDLAEELARTALSHASASGEFLLRSKASVHSKARRHLAKWYARKKKAPKPG